MGAVHSCIREKFVDGLTKAQATLGEIERAMKNAE